MTEKKELICKKTGDKVLYFKHKSGLDIYVSEMGDFSTVQAFFGTKYGSINTKFKTKQDTEFTEVPEGIAHYLEHKLFENEDCDAFEKYAKTGANANAYTSFDRTCYLFNCSDNYKESLKILLDFVQNPYFTDENVEKERGIIGQEIRMMDDTPSWRVFFNLLSCLYENHPVKIDIAGTVESIAKIDKELLYKCYDTFYNLNNMVLVIAGNVSADEIIAIADEHLKPCDDKGLEVSFPDEPCNIVKKELYDKMEVGIPLFNIGYKCPPVSGKKHLKTEVIASLLLEVATDPSSPLYKEMTDKGYINSSFSSEVFSGDGYFSLIFGGESEHPEKVYEMITAEFERLKKDGFDKKHFEEVKMCSYGMMIRESNNVDAVASNILSAVLEKEPSNGERLSPFDRIEILSEITANDLDEFLKNNILAENCALSVVKPSKEE
jgi:predicted Zn-dependent peptidase